MILKKLVFYFRPQRREFLFLSRLSINSTFLFFFSRASIYKIRRCDWKINSNSLKSKLKTQKPHHYQKSDKKLNN